MPLKAGIWIIATFVIVVALRVGRALFVPIIVGLLLSYVLDPLVTRLAARGLPRGLAATLVFVCTLGATAFTLYSVSAQASTLIARLPDAAQEIRRSVQTRTRPGPIEKVQQAANELHELSTTLPNGAGNGVQKVQIAPASVDIAGYLWASSGEALHLAADFVVILFLAFYLLVSGDLFRRLLIEVAGPTLSKKKITLQILDNISNQISSYLFLRTLISVIVAVATGMALWATGLSQPAVWGIIAGTLNVVPYVGALTATLLIGVAAFLQFHTLTMLALIVGLTALVALLEGYVITPWLTSRAAEMNAVAVFIGLAFWGWLWGLPGLLLAVPLMMILKAVGEHVEGLRPLMTLLRSAPQSARSA